MAKGAHEPCASDRFRCIFRDEARSTAPAALPPVRPAEPVRAGVRPAGPKLLVHGPAPGPLRPPRPRPPGGGGAGGGGGRFASVLPAAPGPIGPRRRRYDLRFCPQESAMPTYHIEMMEGRTVEQKKKLVEEITRVSVQVLGGSPEAVDILITDIKRENWATGGKLWSERH